MSLIRIAARIAAVYALRGKTLVGENVLDSQIGALDATSDGTLRTDEDRPFIAVYSDTGKMQNSSLRGFVENGSTEFLFEMGVTSAHQETNEETGEGVIYPGIPGTDDAFEFLLDLVARQIGDALTDPDNEWADIFMRLNKGVSLIERSRTSGDGSGVRLAAQQIKLTVDLVSDPVKGAELKAAHPLSRFFEKSLDFPELAKTVSLMQLQISDAQPDWVVELRRYGLTSTEGENLQFVPEGADVDIAEVVASPAEVIQ